ncbi:hypothetical protein [Oceanivirga miroungae]|uniref:hypothetical protein n=1 Tax=Oceanivirga miroungae TaxID=1130046 RepID=UPI0012E81BB0|nr:hypothetical protein [Oceanivirga miroungae]
MWFNIPYSTLKRLFRERNIPSPLSRAYKKKGDNKVKAVTEDECSNFDIKLKYTIAQNYAHPYIPEPKYFGEIVETDASIHLLVQWLLYSI